ncbi:hypothetical protein K474DRAFT_1607059 [Panus rudis PR-1116 ss-1]|nr:hypothetical protein K474DRAFT_1607059 [Panus rudis PR-1116 ss-1]
MNSIVGNDDIRGEIFQHWSPSVLLCFRATCRRARNAVEQYIRHHWDVHRFLSRYFKDPLAFRQLQAETGTLISGSSALQFFDRTFYPDSDLDLYVPMSYRVEVGNYLMRCGYTYTPSGRQNSDFHEAVWDSRIANASMHYVVPGVAGVFNFTKAITTATSGQEWLKVQIIVSPICPLESVLRFHSTCVMNVISYAAAYCFYPKATLEKRVSLICQPRSRTRQQAVDKYGRRGWHMLDLAREGVDVDVPTKYFYISLHNQIPSPTRWVGDKRCWTIHFDTSALTCRTLRPSPRSSALSRDPVLGNTWKLDVHENSLPYRISPTFTLVKSP